MKKILKIIGAVIIGFILLFILLGGLLLGADYFGFMPNGHYPCTHEITCGKQQASSSNSTSSSINTNKTIEEELVEVAEEQNKNLPTMLNELTELTKVNASGKNIIFSHRLVNDFKMTQSWVDEKVKKNKIEGECGEPKWKRLLEKGTTIILEYYNNNGELGGKITVNLSDCI